MRWLIAGTLLALLLPGCTSLLGPAGLAVDAITGGVGIYQRYQDRVEQRAQTNAIKELTDEIRLLREAVEAQKLGEKR